MRPLDCATALLLALCAAGEANAGDRTATDAPFGLAWGKLDMVPRPTLVDREANVTGLIYLRGQAPATGRDTLEVVLEVCREEGLQQVVWVSRAFPDAERSEVYANIHREGIDRHGQPRPGPFAGSLRWPEAGVTLAIRHVAGQGSQIIMASEGPGYAACSERHRAEVGHPASEHVVKLIEDVGMPPETGR